MSLTAAIVVETESGEHVEATARCTVDVSWWLCHRMRVSHATYVMATTGKHAANLGHASSATTVEHYEDPRFCEPVTPELFTPWKESKS